MHGRWHRGEETIHHDPIAQIGQFAPGADPRCRQCLFVLATLFGGGVFLVIAGFTLLLAGVVMLVTPGPGLVVILLGLSLLAAEFVAVQRTNDDRPESRTNLGTYFAARGRVAAAETEMRAALALDPTFVPAYVNLADIYRAEQREPVD